MGKKMLVALMMEGKFTGEGLQAFDTDEDLMSAMARELVEKAGVGESADAIWRDLDKERGKIQPHSAVVVEPEPEEGSGCILELSGQPSSQPVPMTFGLDLIEPAAAGKRKKTMLWPKAAETNVQLSLFD
jgi:hypothetical protein